MRHPRRGNMAAEATAIRRAGPAIRTFGPLQKERMPAKASFLFPVFEKGSQNGYQGITKKGLCFWNNTIICKTIYKCNMLE